MFDAVGAERSPRYKALPLPFRIWVICATSIGILLAIYYVFAIRIAGYTFVDAEYFFLLYAIFGSSIFLVLPEDRKLRWYDLALAALVFGINFYFFTWARSIPQMTWPATLPRIVLATILILLIFEGARRGSRGFAWPIAALLFALYPFFADSLPGILKGIPNDFTHTTTLYVFGRDGILGLPGQIIGGILIGFLVFSGFLLSTGAGKVFLDLAFSLLGRYRGGPAKVAIVASGFFGSLSGSVAANVVATCAITIPAMKRLGYPPHYAGAIEACASTGGMIMPPVMAAIAFVMAALLQIPYYVVVITATIPAILYYWGLLIQADAYAAKTGMKGLPREELPSFWRTVKKGWPLLVVLLFLIWGLIYMKWEYMTPFYATGLLFILSFCSRETMLTPRKFLNGLYLTGRIITIVVANILPAALVIAAISMTGLGAAFSTGVVGAGGESLIMIMVLGVAACYVMGMAGLGLTAYLFLALTMAPAIVEVGGLNEIAVHLFIVYYGVIAFITPPVAAGCFIASAIAGAPYMKVAFTAMRLGIVLYIVPFFFVFNPALILQPASFETLYLFVLCLLGILIFAGGLEGYLLRVGRLDMWTRPLLVIGGFLIAVPQWTTTIIGAALTAFVIAIILIRKRGKAEKAVLIE